MMKIAPDNSPYREIPPLEIRAHASTAVNREVEAEASSRILELEAALRARDEFIAMLAHELRNPLAPIRNVAHLVRVLSDSDARFVKASEILERQVAHMARLVDDLLDTARITWGRLTLQTEVVNVVSILAGAVEMMQPQFTSRRHALDVKLPQEELRVHADPTRLAQIFCNLLENAAKYTPDGGKIEVEVRRDGENALVRITDTGVGIPVPKLTEIFELFTQVEPATHRAGGGLGLGLPLVKKLVEMHNGTVEARSDGRGKGSAFVVKLPLECACANDSPDARVRDDSDKDSVSWTTMPVADRRSA
jgi:signal transduction histidine kinase